MITDPVSLLTLVVAGSTLMLWLSTRRLWKGAEAQSKEFLRSVEATEKLAKATEDSAEAAVSQAGTAAQALKISRRPWVTLGGEVLTIEPPVFKDAGVSVKVSFVARNGGQSIAKNVKTLSTIMVGGLVDQAAEVCWSQLEELNSQPGFAALGDVLIGGEGLDNEVLLQADKTDFLPSLDATGLSPIWLVTSAIYVDEFDGLHRTMKAFRFHGADGATAFDVSPGGSPIPGAFRRFGMSNRAD